MNSRQTSILSAAAIIMVMLALSRMLGLVRNRVLAHFFSAEELSLYFAAFRLPEVVFEILVFGSLSSAFIPTFSAYLSRQKEKQAWYIAAVCLNLALLIFCLISLLVFIFGGSIYRVIAAGFSPEELEQIVPLMRILLVVQVFFVISYFLTGVLESLQRFIVPAIAPLFYNFGIILGAVFLYENLGLYAPVVGALVGAFLHFSVQLPFALKMGFRPIWKIDLGHYGVRKIMRLAFPRMIELSFLQIGKLSHLFLASLVSTAAYTYFTFADSLQILPVSLFGASIAKASLPALAKEATKKDKSSFKRIFLSSFNEILFLVVPFSVFLAVLRIPVVRLVFGSARYTWSSTIETSHALSAFSIGIFAEAIIYLLSRAFYALHDTVTPVRISVVTIIINILLSFIFVLGLQWPIWSLAFSFSVTSIIQALIMLLLLDKKLSGFNRKKLLTPFFKILFSSIVSGGFMFLMLKAFDRSVWDKRLSFLGKMGLVLPTSFDRFVLDTRYTLNLIYLTAWVGLVGLGIFLGLAYLLRLEEVRVFSRIILRLKLQKLRLQKSRERDEALTIEDAKDL